MSETEEFEKPPIDFDECDVFYRDEDGNLLVKMAKLSKSGLE